MAKSKVRKVSVNLDPAITLNDAGYAELMQRIQEEVEGAADESDTFQATSVILEVRISDIDTSETSQNAE
jgi:hypothetical protein